MYILGLDIGYSNLKLACGRAGTTPRTEIQPAGAAPRSRLNVRLNIPCMDPIAQTGTDGVRVRIHGEEWVAGVHPGRIEHWGRPLHKDYPTTDSYRALFHAGLLACATRRIDALVTGLPTAQWLDEDYRAALKSSLEGVHKPDGEHAVEIVEATILPQPLGTFIDFLWGRQEENVVRHLKELCVAIIDAGYYSTDWSVITQGALRKALNGTSMKAMAMIFEGAARLIADDDGAEISERQIEEAVADGRPTCIGRQLKPISLTPYLTRAAQEIAPIAIDSVCADLRDADTAPQVVILTGGGADFFEQSARAAFPAARVVTANDRVIANARGYFFARSVA